MGLDCAQGHLEDNRYGRGGRRGAAGHPFSSAGRVSMEDKDTASTESAGSVFESRLTREELVKRSAAAAVAIGAGASLGGVARAATRTRRRTIASTPQDTLVVAVEGDIDT